MGQIERQLGQAIALKELSLNILGTQKVLVQPAPPYRECGC
jgi:hypothetical protein